LAAAAGGAAETTAPSASSLASSSVSLAISDSRRLMSFSKLAVCWSSAALA
jgi:hypothetical protein